eukprot:Rmarinus@m.29560
MLRRIVSIVLLCVVGLVVVNVRHVLNTGPSEREGFPGFMDGRAETRPASPAPKEARHVDPAAAIVRDGLPKYEAPAATGQALPLPTQRQIPERNAPQAYSPKPSTPSLDMDGVYVDEDGVVHLPGWEYYPYVDSPQGDMFCACHMDGDPMSILRVAKDHPKVVAFNTGGWLKQSLKPQGQWRNTFKTKAQGLYVRIGPPPPMKEENLVIPATPPPAVGPPPGEKRMFLGRMTDAQVVDVSQPLLNWLKQFNKVLVAGPARSGTTFGGNMFAYHLDYTLVDELGFGITDWGSFVRKIETIPQVAIQTRAVTYRCHELGDRDDLVVVYMYKDINSIIRSQDKIGWTKREEPGEKSRIQSYVSSKGININIDWSQPVSVIHYELWEQYQSKHVKHWINLNYESMSFSPLWLNPDDCVGNKWGRTGCKKHKDKEEQK